jgi:hypothetical protein
MRGFSWSSHPRLTRLGNHRGVKRTFAGVVILVVVVLGGLYAATVMGSPDAQPVPAIELTQPVRSAEKPKQAKNVTATRPGTASHPRTSRARSPGSTVSASSNERSSGTAPKSSGSGAPRVQIAPVPSGGGEADDDPDNDDGDDGSDSDD